MDVIVPVHRGLEQVKRCLESVLAHPQRTPFELVVVNDASPEPELVAYLEGLAAKGVMTLVTRVEHGGFADAVNAGMIRHPDRDVVLLNSDAEVHGDWLDRLRRCAYREANVGTVTPFSNASYPLSGQGHTLPEGMTLADLDDLFRRENAGQSVEIPTGMGFCMYIRRSCLEEVGYFDGTAFPKGHGAENDFCMRARSLGYKHLLCGDVFVYHGGTFGRDRLAQERLHRRHPTYPQLIAEHAALDPARFLRCRVDMARLRHGGRPKILFITHHLGGGTERCVRDMARLLEGRAEVLVLRPWKESARVELRWEKAGEGWRLFFDLPGDQEGLLACLRHVGIARIHIHHWLGHPPLITRLPAKLGVPYDVTLHDYFALCPQFNLTRADGGYCGEPGPAGCQACLKERPSPWGMDILTWRAFFREVLMGAQRVFAPTWDVIERFKRYIPEAPYVYHPHWEVKEIRVLVLGYLTRFKGLDTLIACAEDAKRRRLPLRFHLIGSPEGESWDPDLPLSCHGPYRDPDLQVLIGCAQPDAFLFPAHCPETYSYTLSAAMATGLPILAQALGAFKERLADYPMAYLFEEMTPVAVNDCLTGLAEIARPYAKAIEDYLAPLRAKPLTASLWEPAPQHLYPVPPKASLANAPREVLWDLLQALVGKPGLTEEEVKAWQAEQEAQWTRLNQRIASLSAELQRLHEALEEKEHQRRALLASTSWRITAPLRWLVLAYRRHFHCGASAVSDR